MFPAYGYTKHTYPQMKMEASNSPLMYEAWPHHYGYPVPTQCHSCCNHIPYPSYYPYAYSPPYPLDPHFHGGYPVYPQPCSFHYPPPPPHYTMELPKYEYDKSHCCGCSHFKPDMSGDKGVKIVEQGSDAVNKEDSLIKNHDSKGVGEEPKLWSGWMPLDMDNLKGLLQNGNLRKDEDQPRNPVHQLPFPMIWLPYNNEEKGDDHTQKLNPAVAAEVEKPSPRTIPVKQMDETADMKTKNIEFEGDKKSTEKGTKIKPSSPTKASRLPPICLRVDPLPKRKNGQGKSRSPSPPGDRVKPFEVVKPSSVADDEVANGVANAEVNGELKVAGSELKSQEAEEKKLEDAIKPEKILSGKEAATIIQSAYRGYEVRRWEPLKKMRQIANIREEAAALKRRIESSADSMDVKQKTALGETIMNLLLKLDIVQGLHSSIRDIRKSVAKELVNLQEMLETIVIKQPDTSQVPDINQAEAKADANESSLSNSAQEPCIGPKGIVGELLSDSFTEQNESDVVEEAAIKNVAEEASIKPVDQEPSPAVADTNHDLLYELPVAAIETHVIEPDKLQESDEASKGEVIIEQDVVSATPDKVETPFEADDQAEQNESSLSSSLTKAEDQCALEMEENTKDQISSLHEPSDVVGQTAIKNVAEEASIKLVDQEPNHDLLDQLPATTETHVTEHDKLQGSDEASKGQVTIEQDVDEEDAKLGEEEVKLAIPSTENNFKEENEKMRDLLEKLIVSGKEQQEVIWNLNEKLRELEDKLAKQKKKRGSRTRKARVVMNRSSKGLAS